MPFKQRTCPHCGKVIKQSDITKNKKSEQINIRLSPSEKLTLEKMARRGGFSSLSEYLVSIGLTS